MKFCLLTCLLMVLPASDLRGQGPSSTSKSGQRYEMVSFFLKPNGAAEFAWSVTSFGNGTGTFHSRHAGQWTETPIKLSPVTIQLLAKGKSSVERRACETKARNIARTGQKTLTYGLGPSALDCTFNYSDDETVNAIAGSFMAIAETMQIGEGLERDLRFDRLGLDAEMDSLAQEMKDGRAIEVQNIAPALKSIVDDERVMERVRRKAGRMLSEIGVTVPAP